LVGAGGAAALQVPAMRTLPGIEVAARVEADFIGIRERGKPRSATRPCWMHSSLRRKPSDCLVFKSAVESLTELPAK
jgi:hypothetical protein